MTEMGSDQGFAFTVVNFASTSHDIWENKYIYL